MQYISQLNLPVNLTVNVRRFYNSVPQYHNSLTGLLTHFSY